MAQPDKINPRILGQRIAAARKARGNTPEEAAELLQCSRPRYIAIEKGERQAKSDEIIKLAAFLGRKVHELVRPTEPILDVHPDLRAVAEKMVAANDEALNAAINELRRLTEDYRDLEDLAPRGAAEPLDFAAQPIGGFPFPERYKSLAVAAYQRGDIGDSDLAYYLRCDIVTARETAIASVSEPTASAPGSTTP